MLRHINWEQDFGKDFFSLEFPLSYSNFPMYTQIYTNGLVCNKLIQVTCIIVLVVTLGKRQKTMWYNLCYMWFRSSKDLKGVMISKLLLRQCVESNPGPKPNI